jgi:ABC-type molybdate transport system substrate-binding protein
MTPSRTPRRLGLASLTLLTTASALTACGSDAAPAKAAAAIQPGTAAQQLTKECGSSIVIQLQWQPQSDMGALFQLLGPDYKVDPKTKSVTGTLVTDGKDTGVKLTLRAGGSAIGFQSVASQMYVDDTIDFGLVHADQMIAASGEHPVVGVTPLLTHTPAILTWNPDKYGKDFSLKELASTDATVVVSPEQAFPAWLVAKGYARKDQIDTSYDGNPSRFIADPTIVQQGFGNSEPYTYEHDTPAWDKPVGYQLLKDVGYNSYASNLSVRADKLTEKAPCLKRLVPLVQQAGVDYLTDPKPTNKVIVDVIAADSTFFPYSIGEATYSAKFLTEHGLIENEDGFLGGYDAARTKEFVGEVAPIIRAQGNDVPADLSADKLFTNQFVDESIKLP